jgi:hypothetical protein
MNPNQIVLQLSPQACDAFFPLEVRKNTVEKKELSTGSRAVSTIDESP